MLAWMLALAALVMFAWASTCIAALLSRLATLRMPGVPKARLGPLLAARSGLRGVALGVLLAALACGLFYGVLYGALYGALADAAAKLMAQRD